MPKKDPFNRPYLVIASFVYSEQLGIKQHSDAIPRERSISLIKF